MIETLALSLTPILLNKGWNWCVKKAIKPPAKCSTSVLLLQNKGGKSTLCESLNNNDSDVIFVDIDDAIKKDQAAQQKLSPHKEGTMMYNLIFRKEFEKILSEMKSEYVKKMKKRVVLVTSNVKVAFDSYAKNFFVALPSKSFAQKILQTATEVDKLHIFESREEFWRRLTDVQSKGQFCSYNSYEELAQIIKHSYNILSNI